MTSLIFSQFSLWAFLIFGSALLWGLTFWKDKDKGLAGIVNGVFVVAVVTTFCLGLRYGTDVDDFCVINGHVTSATYEEEWTEEYYETVTDHDSKGNATGSHQERHTRNHGPEWMVGTTVGNHTISEARYNTLVRRFKTQRQTDSGHMGQCSYGNGRTFEASWNGRADTLVPWSDTVSVVNWVKASKGTVEKRLGGEGFAVLDYPGLVESEHGPRQPKLNLVWAPTPGTKLPFDPVWIKAIEWDLDVLADAVGASKQANPILIITNQGPGYTEAQRSKWCNGKKNDIILIVGISQWPTVEWVDVLCWDNGATLAPVLKMDLQSMDITDRAKLLRTFGGAIQKHFERKPMAEFEYLKAGINVPGWIYLVSFIILVAGGAAVLFIDVTPRFPSNRYGRRYR